MADALPQEGERLAKRVAALQGCSRNEAERLIGNGHVQVAGTVVTDPARRVNHETITVQAPASQAVLRPATVLWHKPATQLLAAEQNMTGLVEPTQELQPWHLKHLRCLTPLPTIASGLAVFAQDARTLQRLRETVTGLEQEWLLDVAGAVSPDQLDTLRASAPTLAAARLAVHCKISVGSQGAGQTRLRLALKHGDAAQLTHWLQAAGLTALRLHRTRIGRQALGALQAGGCRLLAAQERL